MTRFSPIHCSHLYVMKGIYFHQKSLRKIFDIQQMHDIVIVIYTIQYELMPLLSA